MFVVGGLVGVSCVVVDCSSVLCCLKCVRGLRVGRVSCGGCVFMVCVLVSRSVFGVCVCLRCGERFFRGVAPGLRVLLRA